MMFPFVADLAAEGPWRWPVRCAGTVPGVVLPVAAPAGRRR